MGLATLYGRELRPGSGFDSDSSPLVTRAEKANPGGRSARRVPLAPAAERCDSAGSRQIAFAAKFGCGKASGPVCGIRVPFVEVSGDD